MVIRNLIPKSNIPLIRKEINKISKILIKNYKPPYVHLTKDFKLNTAHHLNKIFLISKLMKLGSNKVKTFLEKKFREKILMQNFEIFAKPNQTGRKVLFIKTTFTGI